MAIRIKCPYCFAEFNDDEVHFRADFVGDARARDAILRDKGYRDLASFDLGYEGGDKAQIKKQYEEVGFYSPVDDPKYTTWWNDFGGTTEIDPLNEGQDNNLLLRRRKVINPRLDKEHLAIQADGGVLIRDPGMNDMVTSVKLCDGNKSVTSMRVCPECHNPLPTKYGLYKVIFISVIGVVGAGKTVYLSQLLNNFMDYCSKSGVSAHVRTGSVHQFIERNGIRNDIKMPDSTPPERFMQPLIYDVEKSIGGNKTETVTIVMYDIAGEIFQARYMDHVSKFAPFLKESDGIIFLVDPKQFRNIAGGDVVNRASEAIQNINATIFGEAGKKYDKPVAVCISKMDSIFDYLQNDLKRYIDSDYNGVPVQNGWGYQKVFNSSEQSDYNTIIGQFIYNNDLSLMNELATGYSNFQFFGFTALGRDCRIVDGRPQGYIVPHRIEQPFLWMLYQLGFVGSNEFECPRCLKRNSSKIKDSYETGLTTEIRGWGPFRHEIQHPHLIKINTQCNMCGKTWYINYSG